jgi:predicted transcriptional regulator
MKCRQYRGREEIIGSILRSAARGEGSIKTKVMYNSFLSYTQLTEYLDYLTGNGLLEYDRASKMYHTTPKGLELLDIYSKLEDMAYFARE